MNEMPAAVVVDLYRLFAAHGIRVWVDGGWGVDALLGEQTRPHKDLDIALEVQDLPQYRSLLAELGYRPKDDPDYRPHNFVLVDPLGHEIDAHAIMLDPDGNGIYGPPENGEMYPAGALTGAGVIAGEPVRCIEASHLLAFHSGYELAEKDIHDVLALCERFGFEVPEEVDRLARDQSRSDVPSWMGIFSPRRSRQSRVN